MTLPVVSVNDLPASILNGDPQAVNLPIVFLMMDKRLTGQKIKQMSLEY